MSIDEASHEGCQATQPESSSMRHLLILGVVGVAAAFLSDVALYCWQHREFDSYRPVEATVTGLSYSDLTGKGRYSRTLVVNLLMSTDEGDVQRKIADGGSPGRAEYSRRTKPGDKVTVWMNRESREVKLFMPTTPKIFSNLLITGPTAGLIAAVISAFLLGKPVARARD